MSGIGKYLASLSPRERRVAGLGGVVVVGMIIFSFWSPIHDRVLRLRHQVKAQVADLAWINEQASVVRRLNASRDRARSGDKRPLLTIIDQTAKSLGIRPRIRQIQPGNEEGTAKVWFDRIVFEDWLKWLDQMSGQGVVVTRLSVTRSSDEPKVNIRLELAGDGG